MSLVVGLPAHFVHEFVINLWRYVEESINVTALEFQLKSSMYL